MKILRSNMLDDELLENVTGGAAGLGDASRRKCEVNGCGCELSVRSYGFECTVCGQKYNKYFEEFVQVGSI